MDARRTALMGLWVVATTFACGGDRGPLTTDVGGTGGVTGTAGTSSAGVQGTGQPGGTTGAAGASVAAGGVTGAAGTNVAAGGVTGAAGALAGSAGATAGTTGTAGSPVGAAAGAPGCIAVGPSIPNDGGAGRMYSPTTATGCVANAFRHDGGACVCQVDTPTVCSAGCTDVRTDDANCGACGLVCPPTSTCNGGRCGPVATTLVAGAAFCQGLSLAVGEAALYFADQGHGTIALVPTACGATFLLSSVEHAPTRLTLAGTWLYWVNSVPVAGNVGTGGMNTVTSTIRKMSTLGGTPTDLVSETNNSGGIVGLAVSTDGAIVYYSAGTKVRTIRASGGVVTDVAQEDHGGFPGALALDGPRIAYGTGLNGDVDIVSILPATVAHCGAFGADGDLDPAQQINCSRVARSQGGLLLDSIVIRDGKVYWGNSNTIDSNDASPGAAQNNVQITSTQNNNITVIAGNAAALYFGEDGLIEKTPYVQDSLATHLARGQMTPTSIALDAKNVYWSTSDCAVHATGL